jgi:hypothetical protein
MSIKHRSAYYLAVALLFALLPSAVIAGSVLVSNPAWQFIGPNPVLGVQANYGGVTLNGASFHASGGVTGPGAIGCLLKRRVNRYRREP